MTRTHEQTHDLDLRELSPEECWLLLGAHRLGRIGYASPDGPVILPLNYLIEDHVLWFRTASYTQLAVHLIGQRVAFQIDDADPTAHTGWSVLLRGSCRHTLPGFGPTHVRWPDPAPWPGGMRSMLFCIEDAEVSGRTLETR